MSTAIRFGRVVVRGVFAPGSSVRVIEAANGTAPHAAGGLIVAEATADESGTVDVDDLQIGVKFFVVGRVDGQRVELAESAHDDAYWDGVPRTPLPDFKPQRPEPQPPAPTAPDGSPWIRA